MSFPPVTINLHLAFTHNKVRQAYVFQITVKYEIKYKECFGKGNKYFKWIQL